MFRKSLSRKMQGHQNGFHFRGHEIKRIETFSDAVFAFAVTLLIVSLEVPRSFEELVISMRGFFPFAICFTLLMLIWHEQHTFFRRYGMEDVLTNSLNCALIFIVLFYVYPLKFLFTLIFSNTIYGAGRSPLSITDAQAPVLMVIYGAGYMIIYFIFFLLYGHALRNKVSLQLTTLEQFDTRTKMYAQLILILVGLLSVITALVLPPAQAGLAGIVYVLITVFLSLYYSIRGRMRRKIYHPDLTAPAEAQDIPLAH